MLTLFNRPLKLYLDTSIPNFLFADDARAKKEVTHIFFSRKVRLTHEFYISGVVLREIEKAPASKQPLLLESLAGIPILNLTEACETLANAYLKASVLPKKSFEDARHVAIATLHNMDAIVSWNFKHLVNLRRIKLVNLINDEMGYKHIQIVSPEEVITL